MNSNKILLGVLAGAAAGAILGILYAPHKGKSTRRRMSEQGDKLMSDLEKILHGFLQKAEE